RAVFGRLLGPRSEPPTSGRGWSSATKAIMDGGVAPRAVHRCRPRSLLSPFELLTVDTSTPRIAGIAARSAAKCSPAPLAVGALAGAGTLNSKRGTAASR